VSLPKVVLTNYAGSLGPAALERLEMALAVALGLGSFDGFDLMPQ
jgi:hypothetical protein